MRILIKFFEPPRDKYSTYEINTTNRQTQQANNRVAALPQKENNREKKLIYKKLSLVL